MNDFLSSLAVFHADAPIRLAVLAALSTQHAYHLHSTPSKPTVSVL